MRLAFTIGAYRLYDFVKLGLHQLADLSPESPVLVSDDLSPESKAIEQLAGNMGVEYRCSQKKRGHFGGDFQALINAMAFAESHDCDVAVKVSQRFIFRERDAIDVIETTFSDDNICVATPGQPRRAIGNKSTQGFTKFAVLSDIVMIRVGCLSPAELLEIYRDRIRREIVPWKEFIECVVHELHTNKFPGRSVLVKEFTDHQDPARPIYCRRYQTVEAEYIKLANKHGFGGRFPVNEWGQIEGPRYFAKPLVV